MDKCKVCDKYQNVCSSIGNDLNRHVCDADEMEKVHDKIEDKLHGKPYTADNFSVRFYNDHFSAESAISIKPYGHVSDITQLFESINLGEALNEIPGAVVAMKLKYHIKSKNIDNSLTTLAAMKHSICFKIEGDFMTRITECFKEQLRDDYYCITGLRIVSDCMWYC